jgi:hypothetical protein
LRITEQRASELCEWTFFGVILRTLSAEKNRGWLKQVERLGRKSKSADSFPLTAFLNAKTGIRWFRGAKRSVECDKRCILTAIR